MVWAREEGGATLPSDASWKLKYTDTAVEDVSGRDGSTFNTVNKDLKALKLADGDATDINGERGLHG